MALFYQIDFTAARHSRRKTWSWIALALFLCLLAGLALWAHSLYEEWKRPDAHARLQQVHLLADRVAEGLDRWRQMAALYAEVSPYVAQEDELPPPLMLRKLDGLVAQGVVPGPGGCDMLLLPERLELNRAGTLRLTGSSPLPEREKAAHRAALAACLTNAVARAGVPWRGTADVRSTCAINWEKAVSGPDDVATRCTLVVRFDVPQAPAFPPPPPELVAAVDSLDGWRKTVRAVKLKAGSGRLESVDTLLRQLVADNRSALGENYIRIEQFARTAVDPLAVTLEIKKTLGGIATTGMVAFEEAWRAVAQRRLWRDASIDKPDLDALLADFGHWSGQIPRRQDLEASDRQATAYLNAMTNGVHSKHITEEKSFWKDVLEPAASDGGRFAATQVREVDLGRGDGRVAFPVWRVAVGVGDAKSSATPLTLADVTAVLSNLETNAAGLWVTEAVLEFDSAAAVPSDRWKAVSKLSVEGRVPCWIGALPRP